MKLTPIYANFFELTFDGHQNTSILDNSLVSYKVNPITETLTITCDVYEETAKDLLSAMDGLKTIHVVIHDRDGLTIIGFKLDIKEFLGHEIDQNFNGDGLLKISAAYRLTKQLNSPITRLNYIKNKN